MVDPDLGPRFFAENSRVVAEPRPGAPRRPKRESAGTILVCIAHSPGSPGSSGSSGSSGCDSDLPLVESHIVNDLIDEVPITVTDCDLVDCARVVTAPQRGVPLDLSVGGIDANRQLLLLLDDDRYPQLSDQLPLDDYPFELTTWGEWRESHPDTLVYVGQADERG
jgi:hypothetical protein